MFHFSILKKEKPLRIQTEDFGYSEFGGVLSSWVTLIFYEQLGHDVFNWDCIKHPCAATLVLCRLCPVRNAGLISVHVSKCVMHVCVHQCGNGVLVCKLVLILYLLKTVEV